jgi:hypothetical protein
METRFGHDFGRVRVHADARAAESARAVGALAYTVGPQVVFAAGQYRPESSAGRRLLAHELAHVVQQGDDNARFQGKVEVGPDDGPEERQAEEAAEAVDAPAAHSFKPLKGAPPVLRRKTGDAASAIGGFFSSLFFGVLGLANVYPESFLLRYLQKLDETNDIEGDPDSDDKAQQIALTWRKGGSNFVLTARRKALLIRELLDGPTSPGDEEAIFELLERSYNHELSYIFGPGGVTAERLAEDITDEPGTRLYEFIYNRFEGGHGAALAGTVKPKGGPPVPLGVELPPVGSTFFNAQLFGGGKVGWTVPCVLDILCTQDRAVVEKLPHLNVKVMDKIEVTRWAFDGKAWKSDVGQATGVNKPDLKLVGIRADRDCNQASQTIFHEVHHQTQGHDVRKTRYTMEVDAYTETEKWAISRGLPDAAEEPGKSLRTPESSGPQAPSAEAIDTKVRLNYGGPAGSAGEEVVGHEGTATTIVELPDGKKDRRPSQPGDRYLQDPPKITNEQLLDRNGWVCPDEPKKQQQK